MKLELPQDYELLNYETIDSTSLQARRLIAKGYGDRTVIVAAEQTSGRGRFDRVWQSEQGNLFFSIILKPVKVAKMLGQLSFIAAVALREALLVHVHDDKNIEFKWPNDVLIEGRKVSGILLESILPANDEMAEWLIIGVGVNIKSHPTNVTFPATSLKAMKVKVSHEELLQSFIWHFEEKLQYWQDEGFEAIRKSWRRFARNLGQQINVNLPKGSFTGLFLDLDEDGTLLVKTEEGEIRKITSGDVYFG